MHFFLLCHSKNYFNLVKVFVLKLFKMVTNQTECHKFLVAKKYKQCEIYRRMCDVYGGACFHKKNVYKWAELFKEEQNSIQDDYQPGRLTVASTPEVVDSVNAVILVGRRVMTEEISEQLRISVCTVHKNVYDDLDFS